MRYVIGSVVLLLTAVIQTPADAFERSGMYLTAGDHTWKEFNSERNLKETGTLYSLGYAGAGQFDGRFTYRPHVELFGGIVDYEGKSRSGEPAATTVNYYGVDLKADGGMCFLTMTDVRIEPFAGLGVRAWLRDLQDSTTASGTRASGYTEGWVTLQARLGARAVATVAAAAEIFFEAGIKVPWFNRVYLEPSAAEGGGTVRLKPGTRSSPFAEVGVKVERLTVSLFYDSLKFAESPGAASGLYQPRSTMDLYGLKVGWKF